MPPRRTTAPQRRSNRCTYREGKRRCPYDGDGNPALCRPHRIAIAEASRPRSPMEVLIGSLGDLLSGRQGDTDAAVQAAAEIFDQWWAVRHGQQNDQPDQPRQPPRQEHRRQQQRPPVDSENELRMAARRVLGFSPTERLTAETVKERRRLLAKKHHPDRGGSVAMMARINDAADVLLASA